MSRTFTGRSTANEVLDGLNLEGTTIIVTGANTGIGKETTYRLAEKGARVIMACRSGDRGRTARDEILAAVPDAKLDLLLLDLSSFAAVREFVDEFLALDCPLHVLVNNAGIFKNEFIKTSDGFESMYQVNFLSTMMLTKLLLEKLKSTSRAVLSSSDQSGSAIHGRVVFVGSAAHAFVRVPNKEDAASLQPTPRDFGFAKTMTGYGKSKLAILMAVRHLAQQPALDIEEGGPRLHVSVLHPGGIHTEISRDSGLADFFMKWLTKLHVMKTIPQGAATTVYCATQDLPPSTFESVYYADCALAEAQASAASREQAFVDQLAAWADAAIGL